MAHHHPSVSGEGIMKRHALAEMASRAYLCIMKLQQASITDYASVLSFYNDVTERTPEKGGRVSPESVADYPPECLNIPSSRLNAAFINGSIDLAKSIVTTSNPWSFSIVSDQLRFSIISLCFKKSCSR